MCDMRTSLTAFAALCAIFQAVQGEVQPLKCSDIKPVKDISIPELRGGWVAIESMSFDRGLASSVPADDAADSGQGQTWRSRLCVHSEIINATDSQLTMLSEVHRPDDDEIEIARNLFLVNREEKGRWSIQSAIKDIQGSEMLVVSVDPCNHLVLILCFPQPPPEGQDSSKSDGELFVTNVSVLSRRQGRGNRGSLSRRELAGIVGHVTEVMGIHDYHPLKYDTKC